MTTELKKVDHSALRTNQAFVIGLNVLAFILDQPWLAVIVMAVMLVGTLFKRPGFGPLYKSIFKPLGLVKPDVLLDNPEPHRFAQGFGSMVMLSASIALLTEATALGWGLVWFVVALAALNLFGGFCVGCAFYYWLNRLNVPGFAKSPPADTFPGARPKVKANQP